MGVVSTNVVDTAAQRNATQRLAPRHRCLTAAPGLGRSRSRYFPAPAPGPAAPPAGPPLPPPAPWPSRGSGSAPPGCTARSRSRRDSTAARPASSGCSCGAAARSPRRTSSATSSRCARSPPRSCRGRRYARWWRQWARTSRIRARWPGWARAEARVCSPGGRPGNRVLRAACRGSWNRRRRGWGRCGRVGGASSVGRR